MDIVYLYAQYVMILTMLVSDGIDHGDSEHFIPNDNGEWYNVFGYIVPYWVSSNDYYSNFIFHKSIIKYS